MSFLDTAPIGLIGRRRLHAAGGWSAIARGLMLLAWVAAAAGPGTGGSVLAAEADDQGQADAQYDEPSWIENAELRVVRTPTGNNGEPLPDPGGAEDAGRIGEVFDSADFQSLLLAESSWDTAFTLDLATGEVFGYPSAALLGSENRILRPSADQGLYITSFIAHDDGRITFSNSPHEYTVEPLPPLVGEISIEELYARQPVYKRRTQAYEPDPEMIERLAGIGENVNVVAFFGTWCQTCKHHLPALLSTLDHTGNQHFSLTLIALDEDITEPAEWLSDCGVGYATPSFIVRIDGDEVGRIEEEPEISMEADLVDILYNGIGR